MFFYKIKKGRRKSFLYTINSWNEKENGSSAIGMCSYTCIQGVDKVHTISIVHLFPAGSAIWPQLQSNAWTGYPADRNQESEKPKTAPSSG